MDAMQSTDGQAPHTRKIMNASQQCCQGARHKREKAADLVVAQPDAALCNAEAEHVVQEGLALGMPLGGGKHLSQHFLKQLQVRLLVKGLHQCTQ